MGPTEVWETYCNREDMAPLFDGMVFGIAFKRRLKALWKQVSNNLDCAAVDQLAFDIHRRNFPYEPFDTEGNLNWYGSQAEDLLSESGKTACTREEEEKKAAKAAATRRLPRPRLPRLPRPRLPRLPRPPRLPRLPRPLPPKEQAIVAMTRNEWFSTLLVYYCSV
jgi:hypothetical protein